MRQAAGQGARLAGRHLHLLAQAVLALVVLTLGGLGVLAWRLDQGPIDLPWLAHRIEAAARTRGLHLVVGRATLAWSGFSRGLGEPVRLELTDLRIPDPGRGPPSVALAQLDAAFAIAPLLAGRFVPYGITLDGLRLELIRDLHGAVALGNRQSAPAHLAVAPGLGGGGLAWRDLRHLHVHDVAASMYDAQLGVVWRIARADADFERGAGARGPVSGHAVLAIAAGAQQATLTLDARQRADGSGSEMRATLTPLDPATLAGLGAAFAPLATLDAPVGLRASADLDSAFALRHASLSGEVGAGTIHAGTGTAPLLDATFSAEGGPERADATLLLHTTPRPDGPRTTISAALHATRAARAWQATVQATVDKVAFADLPALWPAGTGGPDARRWVVQNIPAGEASDGRLSLALDLPADLSDVHLASIDAAIDGHNLTVHWLRPVPPIIDGEARLTVTDPDAIDIAVSSARQARPAGTPGPVEGVAFSHGLVHLTGINERDQYADIRTDLTGSLPDLLAVLNNPRIQLLNRRPVTIRNPAGRFTARLAVARLPLRDDVRMDDLRLSTSGHFTGVHLGGIAVGRDLDDGTIDLSADPDGLRAKGSVRLAGIPAQVLVTMDFRAGPPSQIEKQVAVQGTIDTSQIAALGFDTRGIVNGGVALTATLRARRDGRADITATADLTAADVSAPRFGFAKPVGRPVTATLHVTLDGNRLAAIDGLAVHGSGVDIEGAADFSGGQPQLLRLTRVVLASADDPRATDLAGTIRLPGDTGDALLVDVSGASLDATGVLEHGKRGPGSSARGGATPGPPWRLHAELGRVILGHGRTLEQVRARVENDGSVIRSARLSAIARPATLPGPAAPAPFHLTLAPGGTGRELAADAPDAGAVLRALDVTDAIRGGRMTIAGQYDDSQPGHPLAGTGELHDFRMLNAPVMARVLQAATLYGLLEVLRGPGLGFTTMVVPFGLRDDVLTLNDARAFSASLGFTAKGQIDLNRSTLNVTGTVVPAYALNTLPGRIPILGRLFSPERGGGLFAATYSVHGVVDDPKVGINPLATLTPGFLRGLFGMFGGAGR